MVAISSCGIAFSRAQMVSRIMAWARLTIASIEGVSANIVLARVKISWRVGTCGKCKHASTLDVECAFVRFS